MQHSSAASFARLSATPLPCMPECDLTLSRIVSSPACARCTISCPIASSSGLWQLSTVDDGDLRCMPFFCVEHFESVAMLSFTPGRHCLIRRLSLACVAHGAHGLIRANVPQLIPLEAGAHVRKIDVYGQHSRLLIEAYMIVQQSCLHIVGSLLLL